MEMIPGILGKTFPLELFSIAKLSIDKGSILENYIELLLEAEC